MNERSREILRFIARHEPLERTLQNFPDLDRAQLTELLLGLAAGRASRSRAEAGRRGAAPAPEPRRTGGDKELCLYTDGASRGNPGLAGAGIQIIDSAGEPVLERAVFLGEATNNVAEYLALLIGLEQARTLSPERLEVHMDSELVVRQLNGIYQVRHPDLLPLFQRARQLLQTFPEVRVAHVRREQNAAADRLANQAIDEHLEK
jgi:ribonuclease HI